jgi:hypothetical protein
MNKKYFQDKTVLALLTLNSVVLVTVLIYCVATANKVTEFFAGYRPALGLLAFKSGSKTDIYSFLVFSLLVFAASVVLSYKQFKNSRPDAVLPLVISLLLLSFCLRVLYALVGVRA